MALRSCIAAGLLAVAGWTGGRRVFPGQRSFVLMAVLMAAWIVGSVVEHAAVGAACKATAALLTWPVIMTQPALYALFLYQYVSTDLHGPAMRWRLLLFAPNLILIALALGNGWHGLFYGEGSKLGPPLAGLPRMRYDWGPLFVVALVVNYGWMLLAATLALRGLRAAQPRQRGQWIGFLVMMAVPIGANLAYLGWNTRLLGVDPTSLAFGVTVLGFAWLIRRRQVFAVVPLARQLLFAELPDPVLVLDRDQRVAEANRAALQLLPAEPAFGQALTRWPRLGPPLAALLSGPRPLSLLELQDPSAWYEVQWRDLGEPGQTIGALVQLHDVSQQYRVHAETLRHLAAREAELSQASAMQVLLREQALQDPLTGLLNRRALEQQHAAWETSTGNAAGLSLVLIDLDHFKRVNDTHGHAVGDTVLREVAASLRGGLRAGDALFRIGGEEFALLMPGAGAAQAARRVDDLRALVTASRPAGLPEPITFSAGVASAAAAQAVSLDRLLQAADAALYRAKDEGRNRTVLAAG